MMRVVLCFVLRFTYLDLDLKSFYVSLNRTCSTARNHDVQLESAEVAVFVARELLQEAVYRSNGTPF